GKTVILEELQQILATQQLLVNQRLVIIKNLLVYSTNQMSAWLSQWLEEAAAQNIDLILIETEAPTSRSPWKKYLTQ
ncbi:hypothetical protein KKA14_18205, partial [bacterium]|nr:hypothetical protein [bacterium]